MFDQYIICDDSLRAAHAEAHSYEVDGLDHRQAQAPVVGHPDLDHAAGAAVVPGAEVLLAHDVLVEHQAPSRGSS